MANGSFTSSNAVVATDWNNDAGTLSSDLKTLTWSDGSIWTRSPVSYSGSVPDLSGAWFNNGVPCSIAESGSTLTFINEQGEVASGEFFSGTTVTAKEWSELGGTVSADLKSINWTNGSVWTRTPNLPYLLASNFVPTAEVTSTQLPQFAALTTPDSVSFTLASATVAVISYTATAYIIAGTPPGASPIGDCYDGLYIDNKPILTEDGMGSAAMNAQHRLDYVVPLAAGPHTVTIEYSANLGLTCSFRYRMLNVASGGPNLSASSALIASNFVQADEWTSNSTSNFGDLGTPDTVSFNLAQTTSVIISYSANAFLVPGTGNATNGDCYDSIFIDGKVASSSSSSAAPSWTSEHQMGFVVSLAAGPHSVDVRHAANNGNTCSWNNRSLYILSGAASSGTGSLLVGSNYVSQGEFTSSPNTSTAVGISRLRTPFHSP